MAEKHSSLKRITHRISEELGATRKIAKVTSWKDAWITLQAKFDIQVMNRNGYQENEKQKKHLMKKHEVMLKYYQKTFQDFLNQYDFEKNKINQQEDSKYSNCIWVCWWQGLDSAPEIVKACVASIQKNAGQHPVILLTEENYKEYVDIPEWVEEKKQKGIISRTHYSDILRLTLLSKYGGMWLDATFFCTQPIPEEYFTLPIWSIKRPDYGHASVACGEFANYSLACNCEYRWVYQTILDYVLYYWKNNDIMIDYLFLDYLIVLVQKVDQRIAEVFSKIPSNNPLCDELFKNLDQIYDDSLWNKLKQNTFLFKLTWKQAFPKSKDGKETFYGKLIKE